MTPPGRLYFEISSKISNVAKARPDVARSGAGVLLITEELEEAIALASRILVIYEGAIVGEVTVEGVAPDDTHELVTRIGLLMGGGT